MRKELDEYLCKRYPELFQDRHADMAKTCLCWGFECGDGWFGILDGLCASLMSHVRNHNYNLQFRKTADQQPLAPPVAVQVKEKFGTLRFYLSGATSEMDAMVDMAEALSAKTCEVCGKAGRIRGANWLTCLCDEHAEERGILVDAETAGEIRMLVTGGYCTALVTDAKAQIARVLAPKKDEAAHALHGVCFRYEQKNLNGLAYFDAVEQVSAPESEATNKQST